MPMPSSVSPSEPLPGLRARPLLAILLATRPAFLGVTLFACLIGLATAQIGRAHV